VASVKATFAEQKATNNGSQPQIDNIREFLEDLSEILEVSQAAFES
jgi:hypothetical protein